MGYFSPGIEPVAGDGAAYRLGPGRVAFKPIASLPAGEEVKLTIRARAATAGNHVFRAEVHCQRLGTRLVSEQTTHFYQEGPATLQASRDLPPPPADGQPQAQPPRTADRPPIERLAGAAPSATGFASACLRGAQVSTGRASGTRGIA